MSDTLSNDHEGNQRTILGNKFDIFMYMYAIRQSHNINKIGKPIIVVLEAIFISASSLWLE